MWYKFYAQHGPGHQSSSDYYEWIEGKEETNRKFLKERWEWYFRECEYPIGRYKKLKILPEKILNEKRKLYKARIKDARYMLKILKG